MMSKRSDTWVSFRVLLLALVLLGVTPVPAGAQAGPPEVPPAAPAGAMPLPPHSVVALAGTPHLWIADAAGVLHWAGDTRALAGREIDWSRRREVSLDELQRLPRGEPWLSAGLVRAGERLYLVKWEAAWQQPRLLRIPSLAEVALFGITAQNVARLALEPAEWERRFGFALAGLERTELLAAPASTAAAPQPAAARPTPTPTPAGPDGPPAGQARAEAGASARGAPDELYPLAAHEVEIRRGSQTIRVRPLRTVKTADGREALAGRLIVGFQEHVSAADREQVHRGVAARGIAPARALAAVGPHAQLVDVSAAPSLEAAIAVYRADARVRYAQPDYLLHWLETPNDPYFGLQWGMSTIQAPTAWNTTHGSATRYVAILDCGIYEAGSTSYGSGHPDINGKVVKRVNFTTEPDADDWCDHGTHLAGIAAANTNNGIGVAGTGYDTRLFNVKVGTSQGPLLSWVLSGIRWAADNGAHVINMSLGAPGPCSPAEQDAISYAWSRNAVIVAAAGNFGTSTPVTPASCAYVLAVAATDSFDVKASFSNYGAWVDVAAPGVSIYSTDWIGSYKYLSGTSMAAPHVAGLAALLWATSYGTSNQRVVERLLYTADPIAGTGWLWQYGRINAAAAMPPVCSPRPRVQLSVVPGGAGRLQVTVTAGTAVAGGQNWLRALRFGLADNGVVDIGSQTGLPGNATVTLSPGTRQTTFFVRRVTTGLATTVHFVVVDECGEWPTFVGGGPNAF